jgi:hypothetical protein
MDFTCSRRSIREGARLGVLGAALILLFSPVRAWPWGCEGHQAVAMIAEKHMNAHALEMANKLLRSQPIDPALPRFCVGAGLDLMADSATWPDDLRKVRPEASPWHYIDIPRDAPRSALADSCPAATGCVTSAIERQTDLLRNDSADPRVRADALRFIIHFVGDLHQPLHCVSNNDEGGNCVPVNFFGNPPVERNPQFETYAPNLHAIWDYGIIQRMKGQEPVAQWAASLDQQFSSQEAAWEKAGVNVEDWAWEGHELADSVVYAKLPVAIPVEKPVQVKSCADDDHVSTRMLKLHEQVSQQYVDAVAPTIKEQIAKAGFRLAMVLNQIWP